jgi:DNA ligase-1
MQSRAGKPLLSAPHVALQLKEWFEMYPGVIALDGELYNHGLKHDFERIVSLARKSKPTADDLAKSAEEIQFHVYDVITDDNFPYFGTQDGVSRALIIDELEGKFFSVKVVPSKLVTTKDEIDEQLAVYVEQGYEGQMLRDRNGAYEHKRSKSLLKHKEFIDEEVEILEVLEGVGNWAGYAKAVVIRRANGVVQQSGMRGTQDYAAYLLRIADRLKGTQATCRAQGETADGKLRFPVITFFWEGVRDV